MPEVKKNEIKIVTWFLQAKNLIKFTDAEDTYKLSDTVLKTSDFVKYPLRKGDKVEVEIKEGVVTFLRKQKSESTGKGTEEAYEPTPEEKPAQYNHTEPEVKKVEPPLPEVKKESPEVVGEKELTIYSVSADKKVVKFIEIKEAGWFKTPEELRTKDPTITGLMAKTKVKVVLSEDKVISLAKVASAPAESPKTATSSPETAKKEPTPVKTAEAPVQAKKEWKPYNAQETDARQKSIEAQASVNSACMLVGRVCQSVQPIPSAQSVINMIRPIAEANFALIQELKNK